jgi:hypothetical protein
VVHYQMAGRLALAACEVATSATGQFSTPAAAVREGQLRPLARLPAVDDAAIATSPSSQDRTRQVPADGVGPEAMMLERSPAIDFPEHGTDLGVRGVSQALRRMIRAPCPRLPCLSLLLADGAQRKPAGAAQTASNIARSRVPARSRGQQTAMRSTAWASAARRCSAPCRTQNRLHCSIRCQRGEAALAMSRRRTMAQRAGAHSCRAVG